MVDFTVVPELRILDKLLAGVPLETLARVLGDDIRTMHKVYAREFQQGQMAAGMKIFVEYLKKTPRISYEP